jgi:hypothetical protein
MDNELTNIKLPFKLRKVEPKIIYVDRNDKTSKQKEDWGEGAHVGFDNKIYVFEKNPSKYTLEHEKAHVLIKSEEVPTYTGVAQLLDDEIKADLYTYYKMGQPKSISKHLYSRAGDAIMHHSMADKEKKYNYYHQIKHMLYHIQKVYKKHWDYLPEQWKKDYNGFVISVQQSLEKQKKEGKDTNPPKDYTVGRLKGGGYDIKRARVAKRKGRKYVVVGMVAAK